jgi:acetyltransferase-like isoleucine patch superfamily enzyme
LPSLNDFILKVKRGQGPFYGTLRSVAKGILQPHAPRIPRMLKPPLRLLYEFHFMLIVFWRLVAGLLYRSPLFQSRCASVGKNLTMEGMPYVSGHVEVYVGDNVWLGGKIVILSGSMHDNPKVVIGNNSQLGWNVAISVSKEVIIEDNVYVSFDCRIADGDGHPREADLRAAHMPPKLEDIRPVRICRNAWIGNGAHILKGVTIGEGAIIGANSVVMSNVPPYSLAVGNPARVFMKDFGLPSTGAPAQEQPAPDRA